ncbi:presenilin-1-like [Dysidea avara]|uniref:presenilin-1-like n=1 Tax=Dysidea avara TaxID=196820 RepID=UPI00331B601B
MSDDERPTQATGSNDNLTLVSIDDDQNNDDGTGAEGDASETGAFITPGNEETEVRPRRRHRRSAEEDDSTSCGLVWLFKECLKLLPSFEEDDDSEEISEEERAANNREMLKWGAQQIVSLIIPITLCMTAVVITELSVFIDEPSGTGTLYTPFNENSSSGSGQKLGFALINVLIFLCIIIVMTVVLVVLFKYRCYKIIYGWLLTATVLLLFLFCSFYIGDVILIHNVPFDWITFIVGIWNFGVMGLIVIHWKGPLRLQQAYLILTSAIVASRLLKYIPDWTTWLLLAAISIYDLFAVLCPKGPLRILVETARERNEPIFPSLIYSSTMVWSIGMADNGKKSQSPPNRSNQASNSPESESSIVLDEDQVTNEIAGQLRQEQELQPVSTAEEQPTPADQTEQEEQQQQEEEEEEPRGYKLGLGDFIFYSMLVGKAAHDSDGDWVIIITCFIAILIGLAMTTLLLGILRRALPALPISIFFGLVFYFSTQYLQSPMVQLLVDNQVFI